MTKKSSLPVAAAAMPAGLMLLTQAASASGDSRTHWPGRPSLKGTYGACWNKKTGKLRLGPQGLQDRPARPAPPGRSS